MADHGFISGTIGYAIQLAIKQIVDHINIAVRCRKELDALKLLVERFHSINIEMQEYRKALNSGKINASSHHPLSSSLNRWLNELNDFLEEAYDLAQHCTVPSSYHLISRYRMSRKITRLISVMEEHLNSTPSIAFLHQLQQDVVNRQGLHQITERIDSLKLRIMSTSAECFPSTSSAPPKMKYIDEPLIMEQDYASKRIEELIHSALQKKVLRIGVIWHGRIWQNSTPKKGVQQQPALQINERLESKEEEVVKMWLSGRLSENKFALFLDDVWETSANSLLTELCVPLISPHHNSNITIATSRSNSVLKRLGIPDAATIKVERLREDESWRLFCFHAFPHSDGVLPTSIDSETVRRVCRECGGLPLALKVIGQAMAGVTHSNEWEFALKSLQNVQAYGDVTEKLYGRLRLSYDALADFDISLQLCFLYLSSFPEDEGIFTRTVSMFWIGEGFVTGQDPFQTAKRFVNMLAERCLIEPLLKELDGSVSCFRVHDALLDLAQQIAEKEEKCFFRAGRNLQEFPVNDCLAHFRISLVANSLAHVPNTFGSSHIRSWLMRKNPDLKEIPERVIGRMIHLRVLDLSRTALNSLPKSIGCLKHLVCLRLASTPIKRLPNSISALTNLQILDLHNSNITELSSSLSKLTSLKLLEIGCCKHLQSIAYAISQLTSLEYLRVFNCPNAWIKKGQNKHKRELLSNINDMAALKQLKRLALENNGEIILPGMLGSMKQIDSMWLHLTNMESLPHDMFSLSKLRRLWLTCPQLLQIEDSFYAFQHLSCIRLHNCGMLKRLPALHKVVSLKQLEIIGCSNIEKLPKEFGERGAFPKLEVFSLVNLEKLEEVPVVEEGAMPSLKTLTIMECEALQMLSESYWNLKSMEKIRVYGCSIVLTTMPKNFIKVENKVQTVTLSTADTQTLRKRFMKMISSHEEFIHQEFWNNELFRFLYNIYCMAGCQL
ncbi:hypothetical protein KI387_041918 [Taxus chinensis]|uniref:NB-ARC domain-containing protein n=1 Tax=Taxus chinensis TaxID=29808 RepID=A0AA38C1G9_TAXCH|nr:hypothetical protein KI387_041918 [Taxus chinensis]